MINCSHNKYCDNKWLVSYHYFFYILHSSDCQMIHQHVTLCFLHSADSISFLLKQNLTNYYSAKVSTFKPIPLPFPLRNHNRINQEMKFATKYSANKIQNRKRTSKRTSFLYINSAEKSF